MMNICIAAADQAAANADLPAIGDILVLAVVALSVAILASWFVFYRGPAALELSPPRRNRLPIFLPFLLLVLWIFLSMAASTVFVRILPPAARQDEFASYFAATLVEAAMAVATIAIAASYFPRGLKGFGLNVRTIGRDLPAAFVNLLAVLPLVWLGVWLVDVAGKAFRGPSFEIQPNEGLKVITENPEPVMRILMLSFVLVVVPVFEEVLFRGMIQSAVRSYTHSPWIAIFTASAVFAVMHPWQHWAAIFILAVGLGYAYERSGSLLRPIFMHIFFNAANVIAALLAGQS